jgi:hypothetical protein
MYQAEYLDLVTNVRDGFTDDLTRLSGLLKTIGTQADALDPIRIRVVVQDQQLRKLQADLAATAGMDSLGDISDAADADVMPDESHRPDESLRDIFRRSMDEMVDEVGEGPAEETPTAASVMPSMLDRTNMASNISDISDSLENQGTGDAGSSALSGIAAGRALTTGENIGGVLGEVLTDTTSGSGLDMQVALQEEGNPFQAPVDTIAEQLPSEVVLDAFDPQAFAEAGQFADADRDGSVDMSNIRQLGRMGKLTDVIPEATTNLEALSAGIDESSASFALLKHRLMNVRVGLTTFYDLVAAGLPLILTFVGALPALIAGLGGLAVAAAGAAGALAGIVGLGLLGAAQNEAGGAVPNSEDFQALFEGLGEEFVEAFRPLTERLAPLIEDGIGALGGFFDELAASAQGLLTLRSETRAFADFAAEFVTGTMRDLIAIANASAPLLARLGETIEDLDVLRSLTSVLAQVLPQLFFFGGLIRDAIPDIIKFADGMSQIAVTVASVLGVITSFITSAVSLFGLLGNGNRILGKVIGTLLVLTATVFILNTLVTSTTLGVIKLAGAFILAKVQALLSASSMSAFAIGTIKAKIGAITLSGALQTLAASLIAVAAVAAPLLLLTGVFTVLGSNVLNAKTNVDDLRESLEDLESQRRGMGAEQGVMMGDLDRTVYVDTVNNRSEVNIEGSGTETRNNAEQASFVTSSVFTDNYGNI